MPLLTPITYQSSYLPLNTVLTYPKNAFNFRISVPLPRLIIIQNKNMLAPHIPRFHFALAYQIAKEEHSQRNPLNIIHVDVTYVDNHFRVQHATSVLSVMSDLTGHFVRKNAVRRIWRYWTVFKTLRALRKMYMMARLRKAIMDWACRPNGPIAKLAQKHFASVASIGNK